MADLEKIIKDIKGSFPEEEWYFRIEAAKSVLKSHKVATKYEKRTKRNKDK